MKKSILTLCVLVLTIGYSKAQQSKMTPKVQYSKIVNVPANKLWKVVRQLDQIDKYSSVIASVEYNGAIGKGGERVCHTADGKGYFKERIVAFNDKDKSYSYSLLEGAPVKGMINTMKVVDLGQGKSVLVWWSYYDEFIQNPQMTEEQFQAFMLNSIEELTQKMAMDS